MTTTTTHWAICPNCGKSHKIDRTNWNLFGADCHCDKCVEWAHVDFMATTGKLLGLSCVPGCRCGRGAKQ